METLDILKENRKRKKQKTNVGMLESKVKLEIEDLAREYLDEYTDELMFEVGDIALDAVLTMKDKSPLIDKYIITQIDKTLFTISLRPIEI